MKIRETVATAPRDPHAFEDASTYLNRGEYRSARDRMLKGMPAWFLSPAAHNLIALAHQGVGDEGPAADERAMSGRALQTILDSGQGTEQDPWIVMRPSDEYDVAMLKQKRVTGQSTHGNFLDRLECADGTEMWFHVYQPGAHV